ncbi:sucrase ferredoxin [Klenkia sp. LSe6-5]|uniref:Sucrase ferredoxin n=1 Tax=Klenkia sesuvii TaxID=3103137 RepID=A0ABU8DQT0_9ACTN
MPDAAPQDPYCQHPGDAPRRRPSGRLDEGRCSVQALLAGDSPIATAPPARRWLLVEQPGPWGRDALLQSRFDPVVAPLLAQRAREAGLRIQMVRRPGGRLADAGGRWAVADVRACWVRWSVRDTDAELLEVPLDGSVGSPSTEPTFLVCTHGGHDACCAVRGRPLARALDGDVWETSHLGGDRFAANVLVLPTGHLYGQVPEDGGDLVEAHRRGEVLLTGLRGRAGLTPPAQAAQQFAREQLGSVGVADLPVTGVATPGADADGAQRWTVTMTGPDGDVVVVLDSRLSAHSRRLTCAATTPGRFRTWHLVSVHPAPVHPGGVG